ncbi:MAG TPA: hypothetical protein VGH45_03145 [Solirubrobacteraceae bacterium]|jgi:hypothetical protein
MRRLLLAAVLGALMAVPAVALASTNPKEVWVTDCFSSRFQPKLIVISCGDASNYLDKLRWSSWSPTKAAGSGRDHVNSCTPNCAAGHSKSVRVNVTLSQPRRCRGRLHKVFDKAKLQFPGQTGRNSTQMVTLGCPLKQ